MQLIKLLLNTAMLIHFGVGGMEPPDVFVSTQNCHSTVRAVRKIKYTVLRGGIQVRNVFFLWKVATRAGDVMLTPLTSVWKRDMKQ